MANLFPIVIDVEESAVGSVLRLLNKYPGVVKLHLDLDNAPAKGSYKNGNGNGAATPRPGKRGPRDPNRPRARDVIIASMMDGGPKNLEHLRQALISAGLAPLNVGTTMTGLVNEGISARVRAGVYQLSERALSHLRKQQAPAATPERHPAAAAPEKLSPSEARKRLPAPSAPDDAPSGTDIIISHMVAANGTPVTRLELRDLLIKAGRSGTSVDGAINRLKTQGIIRTVSAGTHEFTPKGKQRHLTKET